MKKITDSLLKRIVRQSLNESYGLLNESADQDTETGIYGGIEKCPAGGFCVGDKSYTEAKQLQTNPPSVNYGIDLTNWAQSIIDLCGNGGMGSTINESTISSVIEKISSEYNSWDADEDKVRTQIKSLKDFPSFCLASEDATQKGYSNFFTKRSFTGVDGGDYREYVLNPIIDLLKNSIRITENYAKTYEESKRKQSEKWQSELKKSGWASRDEWEKAGWKPKPIDYTPGGGGNSANQVSFKGYECISEHPALINTPIPIDKGVGYKLDTGNKTIDSFIFGVQKQGDGDTAIDQGVLYRPDSGIAVNIDCTNKYLKYSLSTNVWNYDAVIDSGGKIALTTDPDLEDDGLSNNSMQLENKKGFRYRLLTEVEYKVGSKGPEVGVIQKKLNLPPDKGTPIYGAKTKAEVEKFQKDKNLPVTGIVDDATYAEIMKEPDPIEPSSTGYTRDLTLKSTGPDVVAIQTRLGISTKGGYGPETENKVKEFQRKYKLSETGIVNKDTFDKIMAMPPAGTPAKYSGKKHNYVKGNTYWIKVTPATEDPQLSGNDGIFKIIEVPNEYTVVIEAVFVSSGTTGGSTQRVLFGEDSKQGTQEVIRGDRDTESNIESGTGTGTGKRIQTGTNVGTTVDPEKQRQRDIRNKEYCDTLRQIKQYLNNTKEADLTVNCKRTQKTYNQIMLALTGGTPVTPVTPVAPVVEPVASTPGGNVRIY